MGNDGGSIPTRRDLVKEAAKEASTAQMFQNKQLTHADSWKLCTFSGEPLETPIVSDYKGRLYNKDAVLRWLLEPKSFTKAQYQLVGHISSIRDVVDLHPHYDTSKTWICPLSMKDVIKESISSKFVYIVPCGHVFAEGALIELNEPVCSECGTKYLSNRDIIAINGSTGDIEKLTKRRDELSKQRLSHSLKKVKSKSKTGAKSKSGSKSSTTEHIKLTNSSKRSLDICDGLKKSGKASETSDQVLPKKIKST